MSSLEIISALSIFISLIFSTFGITNILTQVISVIALIYVITIIIEGYNNDTR